MQRRMRATAIAILTAVFGVAAGAQDGAEPESPPADVDDQVVVFGKALADLRLRIELAENDVYARFNEINSNDLFDIHCYERPAVGSKIQERRCLSNGWRKLDTAFADATIRGLQSASVVNGPNGVATSSGGTNYAPEQYRANQPRMERGAVDEMRELARTDPQLNAAMLRLGQAYQALESVAGTRPEWTLYREVTSGDGGLPFDAERAFEVRVGAADWSHTLAARTFTITSVTGRVRGVRVGCDARDARIDYEEAQEWTIPDSWGACTLYVSAKRGTTFAFYEFESAP